MTPKEAEQVLDRYSDGTATQAERNLVDAWFNKLLREAPPVDPKLLTREAREIDWKRIMKTIEERKLLNSQTESVDESRSSGSQSEVVEESRSSRSIKERYLIDYLKKR